VQEVGRWQFQGSVMRQLTHLKAEEFMKLDRNEIWLEVKQYAMVVVYFAIAMVAVIAIALMLSKQ
jgi:hypothetical protein